LRSKHALRQQWESRLALRIAKSKNGRAMSVEDAARYALEMPEAASPATP